MRIKTSQIFLENKTDSLLQEMIGSDHEITTISAIETAEEASLVFVANKNYLTKLKQLLEKKISLTVVTSPELSKIIKSELEQYPKLSILVSLNVNLAQAIIKQKYADRDFTGAGQWPRIHPSAVIHESVKIPESAFIAPLCVIERGVQIGEGAIIMAGVVIEHDAVIGEESIIQPRATIGSHCILGKKVIIGPGCVIGSEGFGFAQDAQRKNHRIPQTGRVVIGDRVVMGALNTIDRAAYEETVIESGVVIDNLCHIAHNCHIGEDTIIAAQSVIAGTSTLGKRIFLSGQTGVLDHKTIADDVYLLHRAGVVKDVEKSGAYAGLPLLPLQQFLRTQKHVENLATLFQRVKELEKQQAELYNNAKD